jgi:hypothetical protein
MKISAVGVTPESRDGMIMPPGASASPQPLKGRKRILLIDDFVARERTPEASNVYRKNKRKE